MATKNFCDRCGEEIKGPHGGWGSVIVKKGNSTHTIRDMLCDGCVDQIVRNINTVVSPR